MEPDAAPVFAISCPARWFQKSSFGALIQCKFLYEHMISCAYVNISNIKTWKWRKREIILFNYISKDFFLYLQFRFHSNFRYCPHFNDMDKNEKVCPWVRGRCLIWTSQSAMPLLLSTSWMLQLMGLRSRMEENPEVSRPDSELSLPARGVWDVRRDCTTNYEVLINVGSLPHRGVRW